ncbi:MAG TPA: ABC transporter ATP-binding protein [Acidimicrobiales bacterium]|nr:ABC transporter ATP-binding protein [Acidimicrobiales bacterium]
MKDGYGRGWIRGLLPFLANHRRNVAWAFGAAVVGMVIQALTPVVEKVIVDDVVLSHRRPLGPWLGLLLGAGLVSFGAAYIRRFRGGRVALDVQFDLRTAVFERLQRLDFARHDQLDTGQLVSRASSDLGLIQGLLSFLPIVSGNVVLLVVSFVVMLFLSPPLTLVAVLAIPTIGIVAWRLRTAVFPASWDAQQRAAEVTGVVDEAVTGVRVVKGFGQERREVRRLTAVAERLYGARVRTVRLQARLQAALQAVPALAQVAILGFGGWLAYKGQISLGTFLAFSTYLLQLVAPVRMLAGLLSFGQQARAGAERILELLDSNPKVVERDGAQTLHQLRGEVSFDLVSFGYMRSRPVLSGFSLCVRPGETVALVGASGSGKSTVALLLPRFYDVDGGSVRVDGVDVRDVTFESLRRQIGVVFEETFLFSDTVRANIAYGRPDATEEQVLAAARAAEADRFIAELPDGYDTVVGERGLTLSGGQRQRVALARALLTDPRVLILDDATSSIDASTEEEIHATLRRLMEGRTTLLVAHRRSTLRLADRIAVVDRGVVVDDGTHEELLARSVQYRRLVAGPGEGAEGEAELAEPAPVTPPTATPPPARVGGAIAASEGVMLAPTPELMAAVEALPPADHHPEVDVERESAEDPRFGFGRFVRPFRRQLGVGVGLVLVDTILTVLGPVLVKVGIDQGVVNHSLLALAIATLVYLGVVLADWLDTWGEIRYTGRTAERLLFALRVRIFSHLQRLALDFYEREMAGRIMTRMTTDVESLSQLLQTGLVNALVNLFSFVGVAIALIVMDFRLSLVTFAVMPPLLAGTWWFRQRSRRAYDQARERIAVVNANFQENLSGVRVAQAYGQEGRNEQTFRQVSSDYLGTRVGAQRLVAIYFPFVLLLSDVAAALVLGAGAWLVGRHQLSVGVLIAFLLYLDQLFSPIQQLSQTFDQWQQARASMVKINELMRIPVSTPEPDHPIRPGRLEGSVRFESVRFGYQGSRAEALRGVDLDIEPGETVALVGETGAGKSTVVKLLARFYDVTGGRILIDGLPLAELDLAAFRAQLGYVPQEPFLFSGTIRDNIAYGRPSASDAEVETAARAVGAHELVVSLPGGYDYLVSERGRALSAGQRQLIALARARLVDPAILVLDEATSNLDLSTEARVARAMARVARGRTTLLIAHRLPTARSADRIVVMHEGRVVEQGRHDELLARGGRYAGMWAAFDVEPVAG